MARPGETLENPAMRARLVFRETAETTGGELVSFDFFLEPKGIIAEEHIHPRQEERMQVLQGTLHGRISGEPSEARAGEEYTMTPGTRHAWWNGGDEEVHLIVEFRPALQAETLFETVFGLARDGKTREGGVPNLLQLAVLLRAYPGEFYPARLPRMIRPLIVSVLAPIATLFGYRARYPKYSSDGGQH